MGTEPTVHDVNTDDQELAKALAGISQEVSAPNNSLAFEETPAPGSPVTDSPFTNPSLLGDAAVSAPAAEPVGSLPVTPEPEEDQPPVASNFAPPAPEPTSATGTGGLDSIKKNALDELRPLVDKLNVPADEKFDTYLLLLRSTDDPSLIAPAHEAAKEIPDEARRAQALLDVIKEIDYLSANK